MVTVLAMWLKKLGVLAKKKLFADMHRMTCGWSGSADFPAISSESQQSSIDSAGLTFSGRSRKKMAWMGFIHRSRR